MLVEAYTALKERGIKLEVVFCSLDNDILSFAEYLTEMPWSVTLFYRRGIITGYC